MTTTSPALESLRDALNRLYAWRDHADLMARMHEGEPRAERYLNEKANYQATINMALPAVRALEAAAAAFESVRMHDSNRCRYVAEILRPHHRPHTV